MAISLRLAQTTQQDSVTKKARQGTGVVALIPLIPELRRKREVDLWVLDQPSVDSEFQASWRYIPVSRKGGKKAKF